MMKIKKSSATKTFLLASASKLALLPGAASAGKEEQPPEHELQPLKLHQIAVPFDAFIPPFNDEDFGLDGSMFEDELGDFDDRGVLFVGEMSAGARMDFVISHLRKDMPVDVVLVYSKGIAYEGEELPPGLEDRYSPIGPEMGRMEPNINPIGPRQGNREGLEQELNQLHQQLHELEIGGPENEKAIQKAIKEVERLERKLMKHEEGQGPGWKPKPEGSALSAKQAFGVERTGAGEICLDLRDGQWEVIAGVRVQPMQQFLDAPTKFGRTLPNPRSVTISVDLSDLINFEEREIFIQALAFPVPDPGMPPLSNLDFASAQVSECDRFLVHHPYSPEEGEEGFEDESYTGGKGDGDEEIPGGDPGMPEGDGCNGKMC
jgi:hypothetical protein